MNTPLLRHKIWLVSCLILDVLLLPLYGLGLILGIYHYISYTNYSLLISEKSLVFKKGVLTKTEDEIPYQKINNINIRTGIFGQFFDYGDLLILTGNDVHPTVFTYMPSPKEIKKQIMDIVHKPTGQ